MPVRRPEASREGIVVITGSPGTGKKTVAPLVARALGVRCLSLNDLAKAAGLVKGDGSSVDTGALARTLSNSPAGPAVIYGHLAPYALGTDSVISAIVLRCDPQVLKSRLTERGYSKAKVEENLEAELIGVIADEAYRTFGEELTREVDSSKSDPQRLADSIVTLVRDMKKTKRIDWTFRYNTASMLRALLPG